MLSRVRTSLIALAALAAVSVAAAVLSVPTEAQAAVVSCTQSATSTELIQCDLCDLYATMQNLINIGAGALVGIGVLAIVIGAFRYITSTGASALIETAKKTIQYAITGIIVVTLAFVIVQVVFTALTGKADGIFSGITCKLPTTEDPGAPGGGEPAPTPPPTTGPPTAPPPSGKDCEGTVGGCKDSPALTSFMSCFEGELGSQVNLGSSKNTYGDDHATNSCHYGGRSCTDGAHAVDYGGAPGTGKGQGSFSAADAKLIQQAAAKCGAQVGGATVRGEDAQSRSRPIEGSTTTHIHINVANQSCGCN